MTQLDLHGTAITAALGPTNTGKTHSAIQRMLAHRTGMMGLPLRLLAREVYERVVALRGPEVVALCTGEERIEPPGARYWICTTEAMPVERPVAFLAVDEIQLCAHPERGHIFTERLLHARGAAETWFLGSEAMAPRIEELLPTARIQRRPRLSTLRHEGPHPLSRLPPRTAVVAFGAARVYELAERLRRRRGGAAVVLGALSPRTRNAQVALFQSGEVPYLVATDAIGMGLNLDLDHVAFSGLVRFDGTQVRALTRSEVGQIAGRAGRYRRDGSFGAVQGECELDPELIAAVEGHQPEPIRLLSWRNTELDLRSPQALLHSLGRRPPPGPLWRKRDALDQRALEGLLARPELARRVQGEAATALLWQVCQVPDFRQSLPEAHLELLARLHGWLSSRAAIVPAEALHAAIERLDRIDGDIETLMARLASIRTWTYICQREQWVPDPRHWQGRARQAEDRLSDALHEGLIARFVDRRTRVSLPGPRREEGEIRLEEDGSVWLLGAPVAQVRGLSLQPDPRGLPAGEAELERLVRSRLAPLVREGLDAWELRLDEEGQLWAQGPLWEAGQLLGRLERGESAAAPRLRPARMDLLGEEDRRALLLRMEARVAVLRELALGPLLGPLPPLDSVGRAVLHHLREGLGACSSAPLRPLLAELQEADRRTLARLGVRLGRHHLYWLPGLQSESVAARALLQAVFTGQAPPSPLPEGPVAPLTTTEALLPLGYRRVGPLLLRLDELERLDAWARAQARRGPIRPDHQALRPLGTPAQAAAVLRALGHRVRPLLAGPPR